MSKHASSKFAVHLKNLYAQHPRRIDVVFSISSMAMLGLTFEQELTWAFLDICISCVLVFIFTYKLRVLSCIAEWATDKAVLAAALVTPFFCYSRAETFYSTFFHTSAGSTNPVHLAIAAVICLLSVFSAFCLFTAIFAKMFPFLWLCRKKIVQNKKVLIQYMAMIIPISVLVIALSKVTFGFIFPVQENGKILVDSIFSTDSAFFYGAASDLWVEGDYGLHPLFALCVAPAVRFIYIVAWLIAYLFSCEIWYIFSILYCIFQGILHVFCAAILYALIKKAAHERFAFICGFLYLSTFPVLLFSLVPERFAVELFFLLVFVYMVVDQQDEATCYIPFAYSCFSLLSSLLIYPILFFKRKFSIKKFLTVTLEYGLISFMLLYVFCPENLVDLMFGRLKNNLFHFTSIVQVKQALIPAEIDWGNIFEEDNYALPKYARFTSPASKGEEKRILFLPNERTENHFFTHSEKNLPLYDAADEYAPTTNSNILQFLAFEKGMFTPPDYLVVDYAANNPPIETQQYRSMLMVDGVISQVFSLKPLDFILGLAIALCALAGFILHYKMLVAQICMWWYLVTLGLLVVIGLGSVENSMYLYASYFSWAQVVLILLLLNRIIRSHKLKLVMLSFACACLLLVNSVTLVRMAYQLQKTFPTWEIVETSETHPKIN